ncbi:MAG: hypothetical protein O1I36_17720 [Cylindrospermopsis raciborskii PAMP2011]|nr:hypothetical protein [Cylindrospermopsis raciborskii PAMP2011]
METNPPKEKTPIPEPEVLEKPSTILSNICLKTGCLLVETSFPDCLTIELIS